MNKKILIPLKSRGESASFLDNVLIEDGKTFIMDNHRLALWCWFQKIKSGKKYNLFHIDAHPDMSDSANAYFSHDLFNITLEDYRAELQKDINVPLFRWDNYIEIFLTHYPQMVGHTISATHHLGSSKTLKEDISPYTLVKRINEIFYERTYVNEYPWIMNVDLDYFFSAHPEKTLLFSEEYVKSLALAIENGLDNEMLEVLTISLSPECSGGWENAERLLEMFGHKLSSFS